MRDAFARSVCPRLLATLLVCIAWVGPGADPAPGQPPGETTVLRAARILDGRGGVLEDRDLVVRDGRIAEIVPRGAGRGDRVHDLTALTVLPGYIDTHVHIGNHFDDDGKVHRPETDPSVAHMTLHGAENAYRTLLNGITTMQSLGSPRDAELKAWIERGVIPGPRLLSSLGAVREGTGTPDQIRAYVRDRAAAGADVIKVFASTSIRFGGVTNMSGEQLEAAMRMIAEEGAGVLLYMRQEGRGIGLKNKIMAYKLQEEGLDTVEANHRLGFPADLREYGIGAQIIRECGVRKMRLLTNNPRKIVGLEGYGLEIVGRESIEFESNTMNKKYLKTKRDKLGHFILNED